jgi:hypothetical protein
VQESSCRASAADVAFRAVCAVPSRTLILPYKLLSPNIWQDWIFMDSQSILTCAEA